MGNRKKEVNRYFKTIRGRVFELPPGMYYTNPGRSTSWGFTVDLPTYLKHDDRRKLQFSSTHYWTEEDAFWAACEEIRTIMLKNPDRPYNVRYQNNNSAHPGVALIKRNRKTKKGKFIYFFAISVFTDWGSSDIKHLYIGNEWVFEDRREAKLKEAMAIRESAIKKEYQRQLAAIPTRG